MNALQKSSPGRIARRDRLVQQYAPLVHKMVKKTLHIGSWHVEYEDAVSAGMIALARCAELYHHVHGAKFITYVWWAVVRELVTFSRQWSRNGLTGISDKTMKEIGRIQWEYDPSLPIDERPGPEDAENPVDEDKLHVEHRIREAVRYLPPRAATVIELRFWKGYTLRQVADHLGVSHERVRQIELSAKLKLKRRLSDLFERPEVEGC